MPLVFPIPLQTNTSYCYVVVCLDQTLTLLPLTVASTRAMCEN